MVCEDSHRRVLLVAGGPARNRWKPLLPAHWEAGAAEDVEQARLIQHARPLDAVLLSSDLPCLQQAESFERLFTSPFAPVVLVTERAEGVDEIVLAAARAGATWLPGEAALRRPELLRAVLEGVMRRPGPRRPEGCAGDCDARIDRLVDLLWEAAPGTMPGPWYNQRHMLQRLDEEVARTHRDGGPLAVILGEVQPAGGADGPGAARAREWAAAQIGRHKRRCDVAGQYGLDGFMLLLPRSTPEQARGACRRFRTVLANPPEGLPPVRVSFGWASVPGDRPNVPALLGQAEQRLDAARGAGVA